MRLVGRSNKNSTTVGSDAINFIHKMDGVFNMFHRMDGMHLVKVSVAERPVKFIQLANHIDIFTEYFIDTDSARLFPFPATDVEYCEVALFHFMRQSNNDFENGDE